MARFELDNVELATIGGRAMSTDVFFELGIMYSSGRDVDVDLISAHKWFNLAALGGNDTAKEYRTEIASEMSKAEKVKALKAAREWTNVN